MEPMPRVEIYLTKHCPYCVRATRLLDSKGVDYEVVNVGEDRSRWQEMTRRSQRHTVPQIFIDDVPVGGFDDLAELDRAGSLDPLLGL